MIHVKKNIFLAKCAVLLYCIPALAAYTCRRLTSLLILSVLILAYQSPIHAQLLNEEAESYRVQGYEKQQSGRLDEALTCYLKAISLGNETAIVYNDLGVTYEQLGLPARAEESYLQAIQLDPDYLPPYTNLAYFYENQGNIGKAVIFLRERFNRSKSDDPWLATIRRELERLDPAFSQALIQKQLEQTEAELARKKNEQLQLDIVRAQKHYEKGKQLLQEKNFDQALVEFNRALVLTPDNPKIIKAKEEIAQVQKLETIRKLSEEAAQRVNERDLESAKRIYQEILSDLPEESDLKSDE